MLLRRCVTSVLAAALLAAPISIAPDLAAPAPAEASTTCTRDVDAERALTRMTNSERTSRSRVALTPRKALNQVARNHAHTMCNRSSLHHNPNLARQVSNWRRLGENVGRGTGPKQIHRALMNSEGHRANILRRDYRDIGLGAVRDRNGQLWIVEVFRTPA